MKKNTMMRIASALLVLVILSTCAISGTFAKYVTSDNANDSARVAKFGVIVTAWDNTAFSATYAKDDSDATSTNTVVAYNNTDKLVAPGTKDEGGTSFSITGKPEVAVQVDIVMNVTNDVFLNTGTYADWTTGTTDDKYTVDTAYTPVVFTLKKGEDQVAQGTLAQIETYLEGLSGEKVANTDLSTVYGTYTLTWAWDFPTTADTATDKKDTTLGNLAAGADYTAPAYTAADADTAPLTTLTAATGASSETDGAYNLNIAYDISITVTQID